MQIVVRKTERLQGVIIPPSSKSEAIRALIFALLSKGTSRLHEMLAASDVDDAIAVCKAFGAHIQQHGTSLHIQSSGLPCKVTSPLYTGNSGITTRFVLPLLGLRAHSDVAIEVDCGEQMRARPMGALLNALTDLGMNIEYTKTKGVFPIKVSGTLLGGTTTLTEPISQYLSALLIALPLASRTSHIRVANVSARSYVDMTLEWLDRMNIQYQHQYQEGVDDFIIPGNQQYHSFEHTLAGDFSSASYFMAAGAMFPGNICLKGLNLHDKQGDKKLIDIIQTMGGDIVCREDHIAITGGKPLTGIHIDASLIPDLLPTLAVLGTRSQGCMHIDNVSQARLKETDRIHSMTEGLRKMGARVEEKPNGMIVHYSHLKGASVKGYGDHRTVMALTLAGLLAEGTTVIDDAESIQKTFPDFFDKIKAIGGTIAAC